MKTAALLPFLLMAAMLSIGPVGAKQEQGREGQLGTEALAVPPEVRGWEADRSLPNQDYDNTHYTHGATMSSANVHKLAPAWKVDILGSDAFGAPSPIP